MLKDYCIIVSELRDKLTAQAEKKEILLDDVILLDTLRTLPDYCVLVYDVTSTNRGGLNSVLLGNSPYYYNPVDNGLHDKLMLLRAYVNSNPESINLGTVANMCNQINDLYPGDADIDHCFETLFNCSRAIVWGNITEFIDLNITASIDIIAMAYIEDMVQDNYRYHCNEIPDYILPYVDEERFIIDEVDAIYNSYYEIDINGTTYLYGED